jgi:hypothetical protein
LLEINIIAWCWWLAPVMLATQETDQEEDFSLKLPQANSGDPISKNLLQKKKGLFGMAQDVGPEFKPNPTTY